MFDYSIKNPLYKAQKPINTGEYIPRDWSRIHRLGNGEFRKERNPSRRPPHPETGIVSFPITRCDMFPFHPYEMRPDLPEMGEIPIDINMMPINLQDIEKSVPVEYHDFLPFIHFIRTQLSLDLFGAEDPVIAYLTINNSFVEKGCYQRRPGLHTEAVTIAKSETINSTDTISGNTYYNWGGGANGGIFLASNVAGTTEMFTCILEPSVLGVGGSIDLELEKVILEEESVKNQKNEVYLITDRTPHRALPMKESGHRLFFRLVVGKVDIWYSKHSTANPTGTVPGPETRIINESKFDNCAIM